MRLFWREKTHKSNLIFLVCLLTGGFSPVFAEVYLRSEGGELRFGNARVELILNSQNGHIRQIVNRETGVHHKSTDEGIWPFGLWVGTRERPEQMKAEITADSSQPMNHRLEQTADGQQLVLTYPMLVDDSTKRSTGVGVGLFIELTPERDYFVIRTEIANGGPLWVTSFYAGRGALRTGANSRDEETVWIPARGGFARQGFQDRHLGLPTYAWGWMDYSNPHAGIGTAYVNKKGIQLVFDLEATPEGLIQSWRLFDTRGYWHFEQMMNEEQRALRFQPLEPGSSFLTDEWLIVPHAGDWHRTADVYRERYLEVFRDDYLSWDDLPEAVKSLDLRLGFFVAENSIGNSYPRNTINRLETIEGQVKKVLEGTGADPRRVGVALIFFHPHVGRYPEFFPIFKEAGGDAAWRSLIDRLRELGVAYIEGYTHLSYVHPAAANYVLQADTLGTVPPVNPTAGNRACVDNSAWQKLWRDSLILRYREYGFNAVFADEGHFPWGTCAHYGPAHLHGTSAVDILSANTRGIVALHKLIREGLGPGSMIHVEGSGDVAGRWVEASMAYPDPAVAYTLPFRRYFNFLDAQTPDPDFWEKVNGALAHGYVAMVNVQHDQPVADFAPLQHYVQTRRQLEDSAAPGYPFGFRHDRGVNTTDAALVARSFASERGITVAYYATAPVSARIDVDGGELSHPSLGKQSRSVSLKKDEFGFWILPVRR